MPEDFGIHRNIGKAYLHMGEYAKARRALERVLEMNPEDVIGRQLLDRVKEYEQM